MSSGRGNRDAICENSQGQNTYWRLGGALLRQRLCFKHFRSQQEGLKLKLLSMPLADWKVKICVKEECSHRIRNKQTHNNGEKQYTCFAGAAYSSWCTFHRSKPADHTDTAFEWGFDVVAKVQDLLDADGVSKQSELETSIDFCAKATYDVKMKEKFLQVVAPGLTVDRYLSASKNTQEMEELLNELIGLEFICKAFIYKNGDKESLTLHPSTVPKSK